MNLHINLFLCLRLIHIYLLCSKVMVSCVDKGSCEQTRPHLSKCYKIFNNVKWSALKYTEKKPCSKLLRVTAVYVRKLLLFFPLLWFLTWKVRMMNTFFLPRLSLPRFCRFSLFFFFWLSLLFFFFILLISFRMILCVLLICLKRNLSSWERYHCKCKCGRTSDKKCSLKSIALQMP